MLCDVACLYSVLKGCVLYCICGTLSLSVSSAGKSEEAGEYVTVSTVCVHPLLCMTVKKQRHLLGIGKDL